jgi:hypothetical protein
MTACKRVCLTGTIRVPLPPKEAITPSTPTGNAPGHRGGRPSSPAHPTLAAWSASDCRTEQG